MKSRTIVPRVTREPISVATVNNKNPTELLLEPQGQKLSARVIEPVIEPTMNTRREARGLGASE
eukprot:4647107-Heterocapsa_arctica.AAC.1